MSYEPRVLQITNRLCHMMQEEFIGFAPTDIRLNPETKLSELELDSLDQIELIMAIEDEFGIEITDEVAEEFWVGNDPTIDDVAVLVDQLIGDQV